MAHVPPNSCTEPALGQVVAVLGAQWGDEGKGKLVDILAAGVDICARCNGGANAGHTLVVDGKTFAMHLLPCGVLYPHTKNLIGNGVVVHLKTLMQEVEDLRERDSGVIQRLYISTRAHLLFDVHQRVDGLQEAEKIKTGQAIGTTKRGIGPCFSAKTSRIGLRVGDLLRWTNFDKKYRDLMKMYRSWYGEEIVSSAQEEEELRQHSEYAQILQNQIVDSVLFLHGALEKGHRILVEGANATMLDLDFGTYPYVTSCVTSAGAICSGLGLPPQRLNFSIGVVKAYCTRVGLGFFPTELTDANGHHLQKGGREIGTTTGRARRCGWLDMAMLKYVQMINGFSAINLTKLDVLTGLAELKICVGYRNKTTGECLSEGYFPRTEEDNEEVEPIYEAVPGWSKSIELCRKYQNLPEEAKNYIKRIQDFVGAKIQWVGVGPDRSHMLSL